MIKRIAFCLLLTVLFLGQPAASSAPCDRALFIADTVGGGFSASGANKTYAAITANELGMSYAYMPVGWLEQAELRLGSYTAYEPCLVVLQIGMNDVRVYNEQQGIIAADWGSGYGELLDTIPLYYPDARIVVATMFNPNPSNTSDYEGYNEQIRQQAAVRGHDVADFWQVTAGHTEYISTGSDISFLSPFRGDNWHPDNAGHKALANELISTIGRVYYLPVQARD